MKQHYIALALVSLGLSASCAKVEDPQEIASTTPTESVSYIDPNTPPVDLDLEGEVEMPDLEVEGEDGEMRAVGFQGGKSPSFIGADSVRMQVYLTKMGSTNVYQATVWAHMTKDTKTGKYSIKVKQPNISFSNSYGTNAGNKMTSATAGSWYMAAIIGGDGSSPNEFQGAKRVVTAVPLTAPTGGYDGKKLNQPIPIAAGWTKLSKVSDNVKNGTSTINIGHANLSFKMLGTVFNLKLRNKTVHDMRVDGLKIWYHYLSPYGTFSINRGTNANAIPGEDATTKINAFTWASANSNGYTSLYTGDFTGQKNIFYIGVKDYEEQVVGAVVPASAESGRIPIWGMPVANNATPSQNTDVIIEPWVRGKNAPTTGYNRLSQAETKKSIGKALSSGTVYNMTSYLRSDLMISEVYIANPTGWNMGFIELYNPTTETLDLSRYGLIRVQGGTDPFYWPSYGTNDKDYNNAFVMPLVFVNGDFNSNGQYTNPSGNWPTKLGNNTVQKPTVEYAQRMYTFESSRPVSSGLERVVFDNSGVGAKTQLGPGKTIIIASNYYVQSASNTYGLLFPAKVTLASERFFSGVGVQFYKAYQKGYLQYIVALSSSSFESIPNATPNHKNRIASVNHLTNRDGIMLVKRTATGSAFKGNMYTRIVDFTIPYPGNTDNYSNYQNRYATDDRHFLTRKSGIYIPALVTPLDGTFAKPRYNLDEWHYTPHTTNGSRDEASIDWTFGSPVSVGSREFVAGPSRGDVARWNAVPNHTVPTKKWTSN